MMKMMMMMMMIATHDAIFSTGKELHRWCWNKQNT